MYKDWEKFFDTLTDAQAGKAIKAAFAFVARAEMPDFKSTLHLVFLMMKDAFERDGAKWEEICEKNAENGRRGGLAKKANATERNQPLPNGKRGLANLADKDNVKEKDNVNDTDKESEKEREAFAPVPTAPTLPKYKQFYSFPFIKLTEQEHTELVNSFGDSITEDYISRLNYYLVEHPEKNYSSHSATIRKWIIQDGADKKAKEASEVDKYKQFINQF